MENNNHSIIKRLAINNITSNKRRAITIVVAIILTCVLITSVMTVSINLLHTMQETLAMRSGSNAELGFLKIEPTIADQLITHPLLKNHGLSTIIGSVEDEKLSRRLTEVRTMDKFYMDSTFSSLVSGRTPVNFDEITIDTILAKLLGIEQLTDDYYSISMSIGNEIITNQFKIVGITESNQLSNASYLIVSIPFKDYYCTDKIGNHMLGGRDILVNFNNNQSLIKNIETILNDLNISFEDANPSPNPAYSLDALSISPLNIIAYLIFIIMLMVSSYLIISNIYLISIRKDAKKFGLLKAVGTTKKQLKKIIYTEALILFTIALPIGLIIGYIFGVLLVPIILSTLNVEYSSIYNHPLIFVFASLLSFVTIFISCMKPARLISKISPIEATKEQTYQYYRNKKKRQKGNRIHKMAFKGIFINRKQTNFVILSLALSLIIFCVTIIEITEIDKNSFVRQMIGSDYIIANSDYFQINYEGSYLSQNLVSEVDGELYPIYREVSKIDLSPMQKKNFSDLITAPDSTRIGQIELMKGEVEIEIYGLNDYYLLQMKDYVTSGQIPSSLKENEIILDDLYFLDEHASIPLKAGDSIEVSDIHYKIVAIVNNIPSYYHDKSFRENSIHGFTTMNNDQIMTLLVNGSLNKKVLEDKFPDITIKSRQDYIDQIENYTNMIFIVGSSLSFILALIGIINFSNLTITSIFTRKRELAILEGLGMTCKQIKRQLSYEGLYIVLIASLLTILSTSVISIMLEGAISKSFILPLCLIVVLLICIAIFIPKHAYHNMRKEDLVKRISYKE